jgi:hypothetical protein
MPFPVFLVASPVRWVCRPEFVATATDLPFVVDTIVDTAGGLSDLDCLKETDALAVRHGEEDVEPSR